MIPRGVTQAEVDAYREKFREYVKNGGDPDAKTMQERVEEEFKRNGWTLWNSVFHLKPIEKGEVNGDSIKADHGH